MTHEFQLPFAELFSSYLETQVRRTLTAEGPTKVNDNVTRWEVQVGGQRIGEYRIVESPLGKKIGFVYEGKIPGYVNPAWTGLGATEDSVALQFDSTSGKWCRKDGHTMIPFP